MRLIDRIKRYFQKSTGIVKDFYICLSYIKEWRLDKEHSLLHGLKLADQPQKLGEKHPDKKIYVMSLEVEHSGIASMVIYSLAQLRYAKWKGYTPVIDMKWQYLWTGNVKDQNGWEFYYKQPAGVSVQEAYESSQVYFCDPSIFHIPLLYFIDELYDNRRAVRIYHKYYRRYCHYQDDLQAYIDEQKQKILKLGRRILGCSIRMGYVLEMMIQVKNMNGHSRQPDSLDIFIKDLTALMKKWNCDYIFLSTDDAGSVEYLQQHFGEKLLFLERNRDRFTNQNQIAATKPVLDDRFPTIRQDNNAYLAELEILAECQCYLCGQNGGSMLAMILNNGRFEHQQIYRMGYWVMDEEDTL